MSDERQAFEQLHAIPSGAEWCEKRHIYIHKKYSGLVLHPINESWEAFCEGALWQASRQAVSVPEETLTAIHDTLRLVWSRELSADDGMDEIEILIPPTGWDSEGYPPIGWHGQARLGGNLTWLECIVLSGHALAVGGEGDWTIEFIFEDKAPEFKPLPTKEDQEREAFALSIQSAIERYTPRTVEAWFPIVGERCQVIELPGIYIECEILANRCGDYIYYVPEKHAYGMLAAGAFRPIRTQALYDAGMLRRVGE